MIITKNDCRNPYVGQSCPVYCARPLCQQYIWVAMSFKAIYNLHMKMKSISRAIVILLFLCVPILCGEPEISISTNYYHLYSFTQSGLRREMNEKGFRWTDGMTYDAFTSWYVQWRYNYDTRYGNCALRDIEVSVDVEYTLPKWSVQFLGNKELRIKWIRYIDALKKHEDGHRDIGIGAAKRIEAALYKVGTRPRCDTLGAEANAIAYKILDDFRRKEIEYDRSTGHGRTQGAVFP